MHPGEVARRLDARCEGGTIFQQKVNERGMFNVKNCTLKGKGLDLGASLPYFVEYTPGLWRPQGDLISKYALYHPTHGKPKPVLSTLLK